MSEEKQAGAAAVVARVIQQERLHHGSFLQWVRLSSTSVFMLITGLLVSYGSSEPFEYFRRIALYWLASIALLVGYRVSPALAHRAGWAIVAVDLPFIYFINERAVTASAAPSAWANHALALVIFLVAVTGLLFNTRLTAVVAAGAAACFAGLAIHAGQTPLQISTGLTVVLMMGTLTTFVAFRMHKLSERAVDDALLSERATAEARTHKENFERLIRGNPGNLFLHRNGVVLFANQAIIDLLGCQAEQAETQIAERLLAPLQAATASGGLSTGPREVTVTRRDGSALHLEATDLVLNTEGGPTIATSVRDLTSLRQAQAQLLISNRMAALGTLAAGLVHEVKNPLSYVGTNLDFVQSSLPASALGGSELDEALKEARHGVAQINEIVQAFKIFSHPSRGTPVPVAVVDAIESAIRIAMPEIRSRAELVRRFDFHPIILGSASRLSQVLLNLLVNAAQAFPETGALEGPRDGNRKTITVSIERGSGQCIISVRDNGIGMSAAVLKNLFVPFFSTKPEGQGTGLGLSISKSIVEEMGGVLSVESTPGVGSCFSLKLPVVGEQSVSPQEKRPAPTVGAGPA